jgi:Lipase (class 3)
MIPQIKSNRVTGLVSLMALVILALAAAGCWGDKKPVIQTVASSMLPTGGDPEREKKIIEWAYHFTLLIYDLPGFESERQGQRARTAYETYRTKVAKDYIEEYSLADPFTGLKVALFKPVGEAAKLNLWVLAFAGSESISDWIGDVGSGKEQFEVFRKMLKENLGKYSQGVMGTSPELLITGHSLGGGLAQVAAYQIDKEMQARLKIHLVTWNALGTIDLIKKLDPTVTEQELRGRNERLGFVAHYFVCDDIVSQLGRHWQGTLRKVDDRRCSNPEVRLPRPSDGIRRFLSTLPERFRGRRREPINQIRIAQAHYKETFNTAVEGNWAQLHKAPVDMEHDGSELTKVGLDGVLRRLPDTWPKLTRGLRDEALIFWLRRANSCETSNEYDHGFLGYLNKTAIYAIDVYKDANRLGQPRRADQLDAVLKKALAQVGDKPCWNNAQ